MTGRWTSNNEVYGSTYKTQDKCPWIFKNCTHIMHTSDSRKSSAARRLSLASARRFRNDTLPMELSFPTVQARKCLTGRHIYLLMYASLNDRSVPLFHGWLFAHFRPGKCMTDDRFPRKGDTQKKQLSRPENSRRRPRAPSVGDGAGHHLMANTNSKICRVHILS